MNHAEIKRRAAERLARRAALPNNWSGMTNAEIRNLLNQYSIGGWRGEAYGRGLVEPRRLLPMFSPRMEFGLNKLGKAVKGHWNQPVYTTRSGKSAWPFVFTPRNTNKYRGGRTAGAYRIGWDGLRPLKPNEERELKKNWFAGLVRRRLKALRAARLERNAVLNGTNKVYKLIRNSPNGQWRLKNQAVANNFNMEIVRNEPMTIRLKPKF